MIDETTREIVRRMTRSQQQQERMDRPEIEPPNLGNSLYWPNELGGAFHRFSWDAQRYVLDGRDGYQALTPTNVSDTDFGVFGGGAPYVDLNGTTKYLSRAQGPFSDIGANSFALWAWATLGTLPAAVMDLLSVWGAATTRQWRVVWSTGPGPLQWRISSDGTAVSSVSTTHASPAVDEPFFIGVYFTPNASGGQIIYVGLASEADLKADAIGGVSVNQIFTGGAAAFVIGNNAALTGYWDGRVSAFGGRTQLLLANADDYFEQRFAETRYLYQ